MRNIQRVYACIYKMIVMRFEFKNNKRLPYMLPLYTVKNLNISRFLELFLKLYEVLMIISEKNNTNNKINH